MEPQGDLIARLGTIVDRLEKVLDDHETRMRSLEQWRWKAAGAAAVVVLVAGYVLK